MARKFEEVVDRAAQRIGQGRVILSERVRAGRRRCQISVGPYRTATSGVDEAQDALARESRKHGSTAPPTSRKPT